VSLHLGCLRRKFPAEGAIGDSCCWHSEVGATLLADAAGSATSCDTTDSGNSSPEAFSEPCAAKKHCFCVCTSFVKTFFLVLWRSPLGTVASFLPQKSQRSHNLDLEFATLGLNPAVKIERCASNAFRYNVRPRYLGRAGSRRRRRGRRLTS
jgi:hypothetical protein